MSVDSESSQRATDFGVVLSDIAVVAGVDSSGPKGHDGYSGKFSSPLAKPKPKHCFHIRNSGKTLYVSLDWVLGFGFLRVVYYCGRRVWICLW